MENRPELNRSLDGKTFQNYYYLKEELIAFCRQEGLQTTGGKDVLTERISHYLDSGIKLTSKTSSRSADVSDITEDSLIENDFVCSQKHRAFFEEKIGKGFTFNVVFMKWLRSNAGKSYRDAIEEYNSIIEKKKKEKTTIDKQFRYNTYIRDFFAENQGRTLEDAIICWKYKKGLPGQPRYEREDLLALIPQDPTFRQEYEKALEIATKAHSGQKRITGEDYIMHPITVSGFCITNKGRITALLHDVVEDTDVTLGDLRAAGFGEDILFAVDCISKREDEETDDYLGRVEASDIAVEVKFADMRHNGSTWPSDWPKKKGKKNFKKYNGRAGKLLLMVGMERAERLTSKETFEWVTSGNC